MKKRKLYTLTTEQQQQWVSCAKDLLEVVIENYPDFVDSVVTGNDGVSPTILYKVSAGPIFPIKAYIRKMGV